MQTLPLPVPKTTHALKHSQRTRLMRSTRKMEALLGETPFFVDASPRSSLLSQSSQTQAQTPPQQHPPRKARAVYIYTPSPRRSSLEHLTEEGEDGLPPPRPILAVRMPPAAPSSAYKRDSQTSQNDRDDAEWVDERPSSIVSTSTTSSFNALFLPTHESKRSSTSSTSSSVISAGAARRAKARKMAKVMRTLGERVPTELVFPPGMPVHVPMPIHAANTGYSTSMNKRRSRRGSVLGMQQPMTSSGMGAGAGPVRRTTLLRQASQRRRIDAAMARGDGENDDEASMYSTPSGDWSTFASSSLLEQSYGPMRTASMRSGAGIPPPPAPAEPMGPPLVRTRSRSGSGSGSASRPISRSSSLSRTPSASQQPGPERTSASTLSRTPSASREVRRPQDFPPAVPFPLSIPPIPQSNTNAQPPPIPRRSSERPTASPSQRSSTSTSSRTATPTASSRSSPTATTPTLTRSGSRSRSTSGPRPSYEQPVPAMPAIPPMPSSTSSKSPPSTSATSASPSSWRPMPKPSLNTKIVSPSASMASLSPASEDGGGGGAGYRLPPPPGLGFVPNPNPNASTSASASASLGYDGRGTHRIEKGWSGEWVSLAGPGSGRRGGKAKSGDGELESMDDVARKLREMKFR
ncbi:hypothetical protein HMN09_00572400 [Mycena chlorophos]|uniref:Uncharacterized protein n=1 Tax=Mycena chlorophos TaxID=658473 RepID=A0A8H6WGM2_MYCCL|nr:hypothetical protein HMN09_00572400 [Mycena chlorophos]